MEENRIMESLKIGITTHCLPEGGGEFQYTQNIIKALDIYAQKMNIDIIMLCYSDSSTFQDVCSQYQSIRYIRVNFLYKFGIKLFHRMLLIFPKLASSLKQLYPLNWLCKKNHIDLMVFPGLSCGPALFKYKQLFMFTDISHRFFPHFPEVSLRNEQRKRNTLFYYGINNATYIIVESIQLKMDIQKYYNAKLEKIFVLYQTISTSLVDIKDNLIDVEMNDYVHKLPRLFLFYPAQLWMHKNHVNLLIAFKKVLDIYPSCQLLLSGSRKPGDEYIFDKISALELNTSVKYLGYVQDKYLPLLYRNARMLVMPTYFGPTNIPTLEAFYFGCPAVISDLPGVKEQVEDAALLFDPESPESIARQIVNLLANDDIREKMIKKGKERIIRLSFQNHYAEFERILNQVLNAKC
jgi:glycosyltransferase involved in cell wall biosynthesis